MTTARWRSLKKDPSRSYKDLPWWGKWKHLDSGEAVDVVKGTNRRVIVVRSPDPRVFEEAIFVVREDFLKDRNAKQVMEEAKDAANDYLRKNVRREKKRRVSRKIGIRKVLFIVGIVVVSLAWVTLYIVNN